MSESNGADLNSAVTHDQKTALAGQIARACAVFCVDEIVVFDDGQAETRAPEHGGYTAFADPNYFLFHILSYLETPPHLRKALFPMHPDLRTAGALPSLDMPHHLRSDDWCPYREGIAVGPFEGDTGSVGTLLDCGMSEQVVVPGEIEKKSRVTVKLPEKPSTDGVYLKGEAVAPESPRTEAGYYWGYDVRQAESLSAVFTECPYDGGYDISIGTSERGSIASSIVNPGGNSYVEPTWKHLLVVFGGVAGLEAALLADEELKRTGVKDIRDVFDRLVNCARGQGSRTIRTEEALWIGLTVLKPLVEAKEAI